MSRSACCKEHFNAHDHEDGCHSHETGHGGIALVPEVRKTWVGERLEGSGEEMDKSGGYEDAGAKVS